jgi:hypothetical protein
MECRRGGLDRIRRTTMMWEATLQRRSRWVDESVGSSPTSSGPLWSRGCARQAKRITAIGRDLDLTETAVREWVKHAEVDGGTRTPMTTSTAVFSTPRPV